MGASTTQISTFVRLLDTIQTSGPVFNAIKKLSDGVHETTPFLAFLNKNAKRPFDGADTVTWDIINEARRAKSYYGATDLVPTEQDFIEPALLFRAYYTIDVTYTRTKLIQNNSKNKMRDYVATCVDQARKGMANALALDLYGDGSTDANTDVAGGTATVIRPITGINAAIPSDTTPSNTYGGVARGTTTGYFNNQAANITAITALTSRDMQTMYAKCCHMNQEPDLIVCSEVSFNQLWALGKKDQWLKDSKEAIDLGFSNSFSFHGTPIISDKYLTGTSDGGYLSNGTLDRIYFLNTKDGFEWKVDSGDDMVMGPILQPTNQHTLTQHLTFSGQLVCTNPRLSGVIYV